MFVLNNNYVYHPFFLCSLGWLPDDEEDALSLHSALGRHLSVDTVATEPWLRPGTSNAKKRPQGDTKQQDGGSTLAVT